MVSKLLERKRRIMETLEIVEEKKPSKDIATGNNETNIDEGEVIIQTSESFVAKRARENAEQEEGESLAAKDETSKPDEGKPAEKKEEVIDTGDTEVSAEDKQIGVDKKIGKVVKQMRDFERKTLLLEGENKTLKEQIETFRKSESATESDSSQEGDVVVPDTGTEPVKPKLDDFEDIEDYYEAHGEYLEKKSDLRFEKYKIEQKELREQETQQAQADESLNAITQKLEEGNKNHEDFNEVVTLEKVNSYNDVIVEVIRESDNPSELLYYLGKNETEASRISELSPMRAAVEIAKIELGFSGKPAQQTKEEKEIELQNNTKKVSDAAEAIDIIGGGGESDEDLSLEDLSQAQYEARRKKSIAAGKG